MPLSAYAKDRYIAPEMSNFAAAQIRDMSSVDSQQEHWLANFILNTIFRTEVRSPQRQQLFNFLRRSHSAFAEYALARESTFAYLDGHEPLKYLETIGHWEAFLAYSWQAHSFIGRGQGFWFKPGDGSVLQRLHALHSRAKHADGALERGDFFEDSLLCVWLTNDGLRSTETSLSFDEMAGVLDDLAELASAVQDPATAFEKLGLESTSASSEELATPARRACGTTGTPRMARDRPV